MKKELNHICTDLLDIFYEESGDPAGVPVILLHGFPYDIHAFDEVVEQLLKESGNREDTGKKYRILAPYLRGYGLTRFLWRTWSPTWDFTEETFLQTAEAFDNPDFAAVVRHSYMHRTGEIEGDPRYAEIEEALCAQPQIRVPAVILLGEEDTVTCPEYSAHDDRKFTQLLEKKIPPGVGHDVPQEAPEAFAQAVHNIC